MNSNEWFDETRKRKFPELWNDVSGTIDYYYHSDEYNGQKILKENGDKYIFFLEELIKKMCEELQ